MDGLLPGNFEDFGLISAFSQASPVVKLVMIGLILASLASWTLIIDKALRLRVLLQQAKKFEDGVSATQNLETFSRRSDLDPNHPLRQMLKLALSQWHDHSQETQPNASLFLESLDRSLSSLMSRSARETEQGLGFLAILATSSPFIGLFGTVWGIMNAFHNIADMKNTNLTFVAPAISEALLATAMGLATAIPAYIAYNKFSLDVEKFNGRLEAFADDLGSVIAKRLSNRTKV